MIRLGRPVRSERGYTLVELLIVTMTLGAVLAGLTLVFMRAYNAEMEMNRRFQAQQDARVAVDRMRREIHCASAVTPTGTSTSITITLPSQCPTSGGSLTTVVYDTFLVSSGRWQLRRAGVRIADYVTAASVFEYFPPEVGKLGRVQVQLPINLTPTQTSKEWRLVADMVLRNTTRL
jgi:type II secretory pathway pseudopilin PulG